MFTSPLLNMAVMSTPIPKDRQSTSVVGSLFHAHSQEYRMLPLKPSTFSSTSESELSDSEQNVIWSKSLGTKLRLQSLSCLASLFTVSWPINNYFTIDLVSLFCVCLFVCLRWSVPRRPSLTGFHSFLMGHNYLIRVPHWFLPYSKILILRY